MTLKDCNKKSSEKCFDCKKCIILKYVRNDYTDFIFAPLHVSHSKLVIENKPISAGFVNLSRMETFGESVSLDLKPKKDDINIIKILLKI